ncbi:MAG: hypothetical protein ACP5N7_01935 [Candidatus Pacearchaeota archaeon]
MDQVLTVSSLYDTQTRGAPPPDYSDAEGQYRSTILNNLQLAYNIREQYHMELNDMSYSQYYLINKQSDMAYNPPKRNASDSRIVTGIVHEKDSTIQSIIVDMNLQPKICFYDKGDEILTELGQMLTARVKKSLEQENFKEKLSEYIRILLSQGNAFIIDERKKKYEAKKIFNKDGTNPAKSKWTTVIEEGDEYCETVAIPNTAVFMPNLLENDLHKQPYIFMVVHMPKVSVEQVYRDYPRWKNVPKFPTNTIPPNTNGIWGDFYLQQPQKEFCEVIIYQSEPNNEYQVFINGVMMLPVQEFDGKITGFPLTYYSPSGTYTIVKGDNEKIPFFAYSKSIPSKNEVKESVANELLRLMVHKMRYSAFPSIGNNADKVLPTNIWDPSTIIPDLKATDLSVLNPNGSITQADFSFYQLISNSIDETSVSKSLEGAQSANQTATQYVDQKKEALKKLGISIDGAMDMLREIYWLRLWNELEYFDKKVKKWSHEDQEFIDAYDSFIASESIGGEMGQINYSLVDNPEEQDMEAQFKNEFNSSKPMRTKYVNPKKVKDFVKRLKDMVYIEVLSEPMGQNTALLGILFNNLMQYAQVQGGPVKNLNYDYIDSIIGENSGFDADKIFLKEKPAELSMPMIDPTTGLPIPGAAGQAMPGGTPGIPSPAGSVQLPKVPQNNILANAR